MGVASFPLVGRAAGEVLFRRPDGAVTAGMFLAAVHRVARELPAGGHVANLCRDRFAFAVALAAAVLRDQVTLLTSDPSADGLRALAGKYPGLYSLSDDPAQDSPLPHHAIRVLLGPAGGTAENPEISATRVAAVVFTSGSTGEPVGHRKPWGALAVRSRRIAERFAMTPARPAGIVGMVPPQHMYGFETTVLLPLHAPASVWCGAAFYPGDVATALAAVPEPRVLVTTPLQIRALLQSPARLPAIARAISATAPLFPEMAAAAEQRWDTEMLEIFGATEVGSIASRRTVEGDVWTLLPDVRLDGDAEDMVVAGPFAVPCALSDVIEIVGEHRFRLLGRRADMVKLAGRRASLAELNRILTGIDGVLDGHFVVPEDLDRHPTARLLVFVVAPERSAEDILAALRGRIEPPFLPRRVIHVDRMPRNEVGKLTGQALGSLRARLGEG